MANLKTREKRRAARLRKTMLKKKQEFPDDDDILEEDEVIEIDTESDDETDDDEEEVEVSEKELKKSYDEPFYGPASWTEADAMREAQEKAMKVRDITWTAEELVRNIIYRPDMSPEQKGKAIAEVGNGFGERVKSIAAHKMEKSLDVDLLEIQAMTAIDLRHTPLAEKVGDWISKTVLTTGAKNKLSDEDFAVVYEENGVKVRKYPIHDKAHVRNALARAAQTMEKGGRAAEDARKALPKIKAAAKKMGIGMEKSNSIIIEKDASGGWRAVLWPSNNFKDLDGEIISDTSHREYVEWVNKNMDAAPVFMTWHIPGTAREHQMDFVAYENGFVLMSAPLTETEAAQLLKMQAQIDLGLSIGGFALERDPKEKNVITKYRMYEVSDLPLERAANPFTEFQVFTKEADVDTLQYLAGILGDEEKARKYIEKAGVKQTALREAGVQEKEAKTPEIETPAAVEKTPDAIPLDAIIERVSKELGMEQLSEQFLALKEQADKVAVLEELVKDLVKSNDEKLAEMIQPPAHKAFSWMEKRATQSTKNIIDETKEEDKKLKKSTPEYWFSEATGTEPVQV